MKTTAITRKKARKIEVNAQVFAWQTEGSKNRDWPPWWLCKLNGKKEPQAIRQKKLRAKRSKAVCAGYSRVSRGSLTAAVTLRESCLCDSCNSAYAWQWFVIHLWFESSLDFNAFLSISNAYLMPHATPHESKAKEQTKQTGSANVQRGVCAMSADAIESSGHFGCQCQCFRWHVCQLAISLLALLKSRPGQTLVFCRLLTLRHRSLVLQFYSSCFAKYYCCYCWRWRRFCRFGLACLSSLLLPL